MSSRGRPVDAELSIRGQFVGVQLGSTQQEIQKPSAATNQPADRRPRRPAASTLDYDDTVRADFLSVPQGLNNAPLLPKSEYSVRGLNTAQDPESTKPHKPVQPAPNGHELPVMEEPELPTSTSADVMGPADFDEGPKRSKWDWIQGVFSIGRREDETALQAAVDGVIAHEGSRQDKPDKENIVDMQAPVSGVVSRGLPPAAVLSELQGQVGAEEEAGSTLHVREAGETVARVVQKLPSLGSVDGKDEKSVPGAWIKSVWGTRQEVDDLDLAIQQALEVEQIDSSKYFSRDYTDFPSVAHYYVHIHDALDEEEVDLLASFAGRLGEDHPLVQAIVEIMEEDGCDDGSIMMDPEHSGLVKSTTPEMGVYISNSGRLKGTSDLEKGVPSVVPNEIASVRAPTQKSLAATSDDTEVTSRTIDMVNDGGSDPSLASASKQPFSRRIEDDDYDDEDTAERRKLRGKHTMVPGMDDLVNELSALSWLSRKGSMKRKVEAMERVDEGRPKLLEGPVRERPRTHVPPTVPAPAPRPAPIPAPAAPTGYAPRPVPVPRPMPPPPRGPALRTDTYPGAPEAKAIRHETATVTRYHTVQTDTASEPRRGLLDIICCLKPKAD